MSWIRRIDLIEPYTCSPLVFRETSFLEPFSPFDEEIEDLCFPLGFSSPCPLDLFETVTDLVQIRRKVKPEYPLKYLCHRVSELESKFERLVKRQGDCDRKYKLTKEIKGSGEKKYTWEAEIQGPPARKYTVEAEEGKYKWTAEIKGGKKELALKKKKKVEKNGGEVEKQKKKKSYDWTTEMKSERENGEVSHTYVIKACSRGEKKEKKEKHEEDKEKKSKSKKKEKARVVVIEEDEEEEEEDVQEERRAIVLKKAFARRNGAVRNKKGKNTEMPYAYAAVMIQRAFRAYLIRRSKSLRALRDLAIAKTKLKELRASFHNFSYRRLISRDAEERQKFSERIIVLLLTVDAIEGVDVMVRGAKRSMVDELEAMLDVVDPQPQGKSLSMRRRTFDMPDSMISKEIADGVTQIVQMLETEEE